MAFTDKEQEVIRFGVKSGKTPDEIKMAIINLRTGYTPQASTQETPKSPATAKDIGIGAAKGAGQIIKDTGDLVVQGIKGIIPGSLENSAIDAAKNKIQGAAGLTDENLAISNQTQQYAKTGTQIVSAAAPIAGVGAIRAASLTSKALTSARPLTENLIAKTQTLIRPESSPVEAVGEVLQGKVRDVKHGLEAFKNIDITDIKTYADLEKKLTGSISSLSSKVDEALAADPTKIPLRQLTTKTTSSGGQEVGRNYVETSLRHLRELYKTTADDARAVEIDELLTRAQADGITRLEVNDISRLYNEEFGSKAFSKLGDPLTSVNAQMYENIRSGLKDIARQGMGGGEAKATDKIISSLYNTRSLISKNVEAVNKLNQRIAERGLFEKIGHGLATYGDILTGGSIRGFVGGLLPRGAGYKVLNALDLEERLQSNLNIINKALKSGSDVEITTAVKALQTQVAEASAPKAKGLLQRVREAGSFIKDNIGDERGFVNFFGSSKPLSATQRKAVETEIAAAQKELQLAEGATRKGRIQQRIKALRLKLR